MLTHMRKREIVPAALKAIRELKAKSDPAFRGGTFGPKANMSHGHLCNIEAGRKRPTEETIYLLAALLEVPVDAISIATDDQTAAVA